MRHPLCHPQHGQSFSQSATRIFIAKTRDPLTIKWHFDRKRKWSCTCALGVGACHQITKLRRTRALLPLRSSEWRRVSVFLSAYQCFYCPPLYNSLFVNNFFKQINIFIHKELPTHFFPATLGSTALLGYVNFGFFSWSARYQTWFSAYAPTDHLTVRFKIIDLFIIISSYVYYLIDGIDLICYKL